MTTTELFGLLQKIGESAEGNPRNTASVAFFSALSKTIDGIHSASEFRKITHYYGDSEIYTQAFKRYINSATGVFESNQSDSSKYVSIGRIFSGFRCGHKNYADRLKTHILNLYRVRLYNKQIMLGKLKKLLETIKKKIGACDIGFDQKMIKNPARHLTRAVRKISAMADNFLFSEDTLSKELVDSIETVRDEAVNLARYETIALCSMLTQEIVSAEEFHVEKRTNGLFWLTNPAILTALTTMNSIAISTSGVAAKLGATQSVKDMSSALHVAAAGLASAALLPVAPVAAFFTAYLVSKLSKTEIVQHLNNNARLRKEFHTVINKISGTGSEETCSYWSNPADYEKRHTQVGKLIQDYNETCSTKYDTGVKMCDYFQNAYQIICSDPIVLELNDISNFKPPNSIHHTKKTQNKTPTLITTHKRTRVNSDNDKSISGGKKTRRLYRKR